MASDMERDLSLDAGFMGLARLGTWVQESTVDAAMGRGLIRAKDRFQEGALD